MGITNPCRPLESPAAATRPGRLKGSSEAAVVEGREAGSITVGSCVSRDYTMTVRSLRNTAGRRAAQCEEQRRVEAGKQVGITTSTSTCTTTTHLHHPPGAEGPAGHHGAGPAVRAGPRTK